MSEICRTLQDEILVSLNGARTAPAAMASVVDTEDSYIDSENVLQLPGWERGIQLEEGVAAYDEAKEALLNSKPMQPLETLPDLTKVAESYALRIATEMNVHNVHPPGIDLLSNLKLYCKISGLVSLNLSRGFFNTGSSVVVSWLVHDGDENRSHRESIMQPSSQYVGIGVAKSTIDNRIYIAALFCDYAAPYTDTGDVIVSLFNSYNVNTTGRLSFEEYQMLVTDLKIPFKHTKTEFYELYPNDNTTSKDAVGGMTLFHLRKALGEFLGDKNDLIRTLITAKNAGRSVLYSSNAKYCPDKENEIIPDIEGLEIDKTSILRKLIDLYDSKNGDLVDEMIENYKFSGESDEVKQLILCEAADTLLESRRGAYPGKNKLQLLIMRLYTMAGPDIDVLMGFQNVPDYDENNPAPWEAYKKSFGKNRNEAMFGCVNWALRTKNWESIKTHIKTISLLLALCQSTYLPEPVSLHRGLAGLPTSVLNEHLHVNAASVIDWPAPSSCATDPTVAESYIKGLAANAQKNSGGTVLFRIGNTCRGLPLQAISRYPKESEILLSPLSSFRVLYRGLGADGLPSDTVVINAKNTQPLDSSEFGKLLSEFTTRCLDDCVAASARLITSSDCINSKISESLAEIAVPASRSVDELFEIMKRKERELSSSMNGAACIISSTLTVETSDPNLVFQ